MAGTIHFFRFNQKLFRIVGIRPLKSPNSPSTSYNWRNLTVLQLHVIMFAVSVAFFLFEAHSFAECGDSFYSSVCYLVLVLSMSAIIPKAADIFILMEKFGKFIERSKRNFHNKTHLKTKSNSSNLT